MIKAVASILLVSAVVLSLFAVTIGYPQCNCDDEGFWGIHSILECQKVSDFLIAVAYFSIPIELIYFISCSNVPFKWVLVEFIAFIVLCGMTHLLTGWTYYGPHLFHLMVPLTVFKFLTALVSCATAITLLTMIPLLLKVKVREVFLRQNVLELDQEIGMIMKKKEASWHVRMLTQEIRKSLDKNTIVYTTLVELSKTLELQNCAIWMLNGNKPEMSLTHQLQRSSFKGYPTVIPVDDPDVRQIQESERVRILGPNSLLGRASSGGRGEPGSVAAIRMPMLRFSNFKGGTPDIVETSYALLVLVLPKSESRAWSYHELEIVEVVADQVAVALSHASILEESQMMRDKLVHQNRVLQQAKKKAVMASEARNSFQKVMSHGMRRPTHSIIGLLSVLQEENMSPEQRILVEAMIRTSNVVSTLIEDVVEMPVKDDGRFPLDMKPFDLHSLIKEASCLIKGSFAYEGAGVSLDVERTLPEWVIGDERRTFQVILHMVGQLLHVSRSGDSAIFRVLSEKDVYFKSSKLEAWRAASVNDYVTVKFEIEVNKRGSRADSSSLDSNITCADDGNKEALSFTMCKKLVQMMKGNIWITQNTCGFVQSMTLLLMFQLAPSTGIAFHKTGDSWERTKSNSVFQGLRVILAEDDDINRAVTKKLLDKLGCQVSTVPSGFECLRALGPKRSSFQVVILDLQMREMDGFEVALRIRKYHSVHWPLIIGLSASAEENIWQRCLQDGVNGLIRKPVVLQGLADELKRVLERAKEGLWRR